jgi:hypothetical protein
MSAKKKCTVFAFHPDRWDEAIFAERFLYPVLNSQEAAVFRAMGRMLFYRFLEYREHSDRTESLIAADLRGAVRDLQLTARFVQAIGESFDAEDLQPEEMPLVTLSAKLAPEIEDLAQRLGAVLPEEGGR